jgi:hypothetical protein
MAPTYIPGAQGPPGNMGSRVNNVGPLGGGPKEQIVLRNDSNYGDLQYFLKKFINEFLNKN